MDTASVLGLSLLLSFVTVDSQNILSEVSLMERCPLTNTKELELLINSAARKVIISHLNMMETQMSKYRMELNDLKDQITEKMNNSSNDCQTEATKIDSVRIVNGSSINEGLVEILMNGEWRSVCDSGWDNHEANVTCRSKGYSGGLSALSSVFGEGSEQSWMLYVSCGGRELSLLLCRPSEIKSSSCFNGRYAGVVCYHSGNDSVRIVNGSSIHEGRVEIDLGGPRYSVCDREWDRREADVTCRSLGYSGGLPALSSLFGEGNQQIRILGNVYCSGSESSLFGCRLSVVNSSSCNNGGHAGVVCYNAGNESVRIINGSSRNEGRVEVLINDEWHGVCGNGWDRREANVICRSKGYSGGIAALSSIFGEGSGQSWMLGDVYCYGGESSFFGCQLPVVKSGSCNNGYAGVVCYFSGNDSVKIVNGSTIHEGRVEIDLGGPRYSVCDRGWDRREADVTCRSLGYSGGLPALSSLFGEGSKQIWMLGDVYCYGGESSLFGCQLSIVKPSSCNNGEHAGVVCYHSGNDSIRIVNGSSSNEGRVEIFLGGQWRGLCDGGWNKFDAKVTCRSIGYSGGFPVSPSFFGESNSEVWLGDIKCDGDEDSLFNCQLISLIMSSSCNSNDRNKGVVCYNTSNEIVRITNRNSTNDDIIVSPDVFISGTWVGLCKDSWDDREAKVICRSLGYYGHGGFIYSRQDRKSGDLFVKDFRCIGTERTLADCAFGIIGPDVCSIYGEVGVQCHIDVKNFTRLANGSSNKEGRVEVYINGNWGTVCDDDWGDEDATVVCRSLGYLGMSTARQSAYFGKGSGSTWLDNVNCKGTEVSIFDCEHNGYGIENCGHSEDAGVTCT